MYKTIVADPPWRYKSALWYRRCSEASAHYDTMSLDEICDYFEPIWAQDDSYLWLWCPTFHLTRGYADRVVRAWGFRPMTTLIWCKPQIGLGYYLRNAHEQLLLGIKGKPGQLLTTQSTWFVAKRGKHSQKPEEAQDIIEKCCAGPYLELFARRKRAGWTCFGDEIE